MSTSSYAAMAQVIALYESARTAVMLEIAITMLLLYDAALTLGREYQYIWCPPKSWVSRVLYVVNRYLALFYNLLIVATIPRLSDTSCTAFVWLIQSLICLNLIGPAAFSALRIYALSKKNKLLIAIALVLSSVPFLLNVTTMYLKQPINLPPPVGCTQNTAESVSMFIGSCLILVDSLAVAVTWIHTRGRNEFTTDTHEPSLQEIMWQNGSLYFVVLLLLNATDMALVAASTAIDVHGGGPAASYVLQFIDPISSILNSRFLLALHETNARLADSAASMSSLSFNFNDASDTLGDSEPESPVLDGYLRPLGGPIYSFYDDDYAGSDLDFAPSLRGSREDDLEMETVKNAGVVVGGGEAEVEVV